MHLPLTTHICAYLDVLGGKKLFQCTEVEEAENFIDLILDLERRLNKMRKDGTPAVRTFTDNVFAAFPLHDSGKHSIQDQVGNFLSEVAIQLQQIFFFSELPVRGGITIGDLYIDSRIIIGPAIVQAVKLEEEATFPRVLLDERVLALLPSKPLCKELLVYTSSDRKNSLNYLGLTPELFKEHRLIIERRLAEYERDDKVRDYYLWLMKYHEDINERVHGLGLAPL